MKICCDVCSKEEATLFCYADEAVLCEACDVGVHHANKLATKHCRFPLLNPNSRNASPLCDICQERRGFIFCKEDRAVLCMKCDLSIHSANEYTQKHNRFFLTGVKLSSLNPISYCSNGVDDESKNLQRSVSNNEILSSASIEKPLGVEDNYSNSDNTSVSTTNNMSEYFMETIPGWLLDDFLHPSSPANAFSYGKL
ncbi:hypothetical protein CXB51_003661 [Gossypium anomalum]|uniref:B box-type domain-containing protein n=1 Tax=Gossypium anomalum TaxID=47600 RepID=A0A8J5Z488_9ROSI|nr:hypothetical protein CXB51_003661 [Gossypium anomalum]